MVHTAVTIEPKDSNNNTRNFTAAEPATSGLCTPNCGLILPKIILQMFSKHRLALNNASTFKFEFNQEQRMHDDNTKNELYNVINDITYLQLTVQKVFVDLDKK